jgi:K+-sensing histidine kinase KdpD
MIDIMDKEKQAANNLFTKSHLYASRGFVLRRTGKWQI